MTIVPELLVNYEFIIEIIEQRSLDPNVYGKNFY